MSKQKESKDLNRSKQITLRMTESDYDEYKERCYQERRSMADVAYDMIQKYLAKGRK